MLLKDKTAIITGTRRGIGRAVLEAFAKNGAYIYAHARIEDQGFLDDIKSISNEYGAQIQPLCFDLKDSAAMKDAVKRIMSAKRPIDILVNNAGITLTSLFQMTTIEQTREQMEVNFFSVFAFTQYISKLMLRQKKGSIINIASTAGQDGNSGKSAYGASKAAVIAMTQSIAEELGESGIRANCIAPGITDTDMLKTMSSEAVEAARLSTDLKRCGETGDIANTAVFLASDLSSYITGQVIRVDGGLK